MYWGYPRPTNSGVCEGFFIYRGALHKNDQTIISLLVGGGYPQGIYLPYRSTNYWHVGTVNIPDRSSHGWYGWGCIFWMEKMSRMSSSNANSPGRACEFHDTAELSVTEDLGFFEAVKKTMDRHVFWKPYVWWLKWLPMFCKHAMQVHHMNHSHSHMNSSDIFHANSSVYCSWAVDNLRLGRWVFFWHLKSEEFYFQGTTGYHQRTHSASSLMQVLKI